MKTLTDHDLDTVSGGDAVPTNDGLLFPDGPGYLPHCSPRDWWIGGTSCSPGDYWI